MAQPPSFGERQLFGESFAVMFRYRTPKPFERVLAAVRLFAGPKISGENLALGHMEQGKEPESNFLWRRRW
jgi:hypothetical protein